MGGRRGWGFKGRSRMRPQGALLGCLGHCQPRRCPGPCSWSPSHQAWRAGSPKESPVPVATPRVSHQLGAVRTGFLDHLVSPFRYPSRTLRCLSASAQLLLLPELVCSLHHGRSELWASPFSISFFLLHVPGLAGVSAHVMQRVQTPSEADVIFAPFLSSASYGMKMKE